jgi:DegV family protein with EDD domain
MKIAISTESTLDLPKELQEKYDISVIPFTVILGDKSGFDGDITPEEIFAYVDETGVLPKTAAVNEFQFDKYFKKLLKSYDAIIHISLSSGISSACQNAVIAANESKNVYVIDSQSLSTGISLLAIYARQLADKGLQPEEIVEKVTARVPFVQASFVINSLNYLYKGGRCSGLARFSAALFRIKPQIIVKDGKMAPYKKYTGRNEKAVASYCSDTLDEFNNPDLSIAFVTHSHATPEMVEIAKEALKKRGFKLIYETVAQATITSHCGPKTLGILYINDGMK